MKVQVRKWRLCSLERAIHSELVTIPQLVYCGGDSVSLCMSSMTRRNCSISARSPTMALGRIVPFLRGAAGVGGGPVGVSFTRPGRREGRDDSALGPRLPGLLFKGTTMLSVEGGRRELSDPMASKDCETERSKLLAVLGGLLEDRGVLSKKYGDKCPGGGVSVCSRSAMLRLW